MTVVVFAAPAPHHGYRIGVRYDGGRGCGWGMRVVVVAAPGAPGYRPSPVRR